MIANRLVYFLKAVDDCSSYFLPWLLVQTYLPSIMREKDNVPNALKTRSCAGSGKTPPKESTVSAFSSSVGVPGAQNVSLVF